MQCNKCGKELSLEDKVCTVCGNVLVEDTPDLDHKVEVSKESVEEFSVPLTSETEVENEGERIKIRFHDTDAISCYNFRSRVYTAHPHEPCTEYLYNETALYDGKSLIEMLNEYKAANIKKGADLSNEVWFKLYSKQKLEHGMRDVYHATWIDYEAQLMHSDVIFDENHLYGLWAMPFSTLLDNFNEESMQHYGRSLFIVKPVPDVDYLLDGKEVIGDKYLVISKLDPSKIEDIVGKEKMEEFYFTNNLKGLVDSLKHYSSEEEVMTFISRLDLINTYFSKTRVNSYEKDKIEESINMVNDFLVKSYVVKSKDLVRDGSINSRDDLIGNIVDHTECNRVFEIKSRHSLYYYTYFTDLNDVINETFSDEELKKIDSNTEKTSKGR